MGTREASAADGLGGAFARVADNLSSLMRGHLELARAELIHDLSQAGRGAGVLVAFLPVVLLGYSLAMAGLGVWLGRWLTTGGGLAAVGGAHLLIGGVGVAIGLSRLRRTRMLDETTVELERTAKTLKEVRKARPEPSAPTLRDPSAGPVAGAPGRLGPPPQGGSDGV